MTGFPKRGEIWRINFDPTLGGEIRKTRPAVIISNDQNNRYSLTVTVLPVTDKGEEVFPFEVFLPQETEGLKKDSKIKCQQIRTLDKIRLVKFLGRMDVSRFAEIERALDLHLGF
jgi:mRNA interferase MazF